MRFMRIPLRPAEFLPLGVKQARLTGFVNVPNECGDTGEFPD
jgi:hypothetical protein